jgi:hypothetical protein
MSAWPKKMRQYDLTGERYPGFSSILAFQFRDKIVPEIVWSSQNKRLCVLALEER